MNRNRIVVVCTAIIIAVIIILAIVYAGSVRRSSTQAPAIGKARVGARAPEFQALTTAGLFDLSQTNKPVFLEIFATWCPHCQRETAIIDRLYNKYKDRVAFLGVTGSDTAMDGVSASSDEDVLRFADKFKVSYPIAYDGSLSVARKYLQGYFPTIAIIGPDKRVHYLNYGEIGFDELDAALKKVI